MSQERTEQATPKKLQDLRKKAQIIRSQDLTSALSLLGMLLTLGLAGNYLVSGLVDMLTRNLSQLGQPRVYNEAVIGAALDFLRLAGPLLAAAVALGIVGNLVQVGFIFSGEPLKPKLSNISPIQGFKRIFSAQTLVDSLKAILKFVILGTGAWVVIRDELETLILSSFNNVWGIYETMAAVAATLAIRLGMLFALIGVLDYFWQRFEFMRRARMTKQELKEEFRETEGDPFIKARLRERRSQISRSRMMQRVPQATLVVTNPTHYAVALYYNERETPAPKVIAKGADAVAQKIIEIANKNNVPIFTRPQIARALFKACQVDDYIPETMFKLIAQLIAAIYARGKARTS